MCACSNDDSCHLGVLMSRYLAPLGFTLAATWVATIFLLVAK